MIPLCFPWLNPLFREQVASVTVAVSGNSARVTAPEMTGERRAILEKLVKEKAERARQSVRTARERALGEIKNEKRVR